MFSIVLFFLQAYNRRTEELSNKMLQAQMRDAIRRNDINAVLKLLREKPGKNFKVNLPDENGNTFLHLAVENEHEEMVKLLLKFKADLFIQNKAEKTPLNRAIELDAVKIVEIMFEEIDKKPLFKMNDLKQTIRTIERKYEENRNLWKNVYAIQEEIMAKSNRTESSQPNEKDRYLCKNIAEGTSLHGYLFQTRLMSLVVKRALDQKYKFSLATEMDAILPFDDISMKYNDNESKDCNFWLLQSKHSFKRKVLSVDCLWTEGNNFYLLKNFIAYCQIIKKNPFEGNEKHINFIIITNSIIEINTGTEKAWNNYLVKKDFSKDDDKFLFIQKEGIKCLTLNDNETYRKEMENKIKTMIDKHSKKIEESTKSKKADDRKICEELKNEKTFRKNFDNFHKNLKIITNYPNVHELDKLIEQEFEKKFPRQNPDFLNSSIQNQMNNYLTTRDSDHENHKKYYKNSEADTLFKSFEN